MQYINLDIFKTQKDSFYFALEKHLLALTGDFSFIWDVYPAVIIGRHQVLKEEVNLKYLKENNIFIFRRPSGGGAVYSDPGCIKYTFISRNKTKDEMYKTHLKVIKDFLKKYYNLNAEFSGRNDLTINGYKFSGNAYYETKEGQVLHGTLLFDTNLEKLSKVLTPSKEKLESKGVKSVKSRVINLSELISVSRNQFKKDIKEYLSKNEIYLTEAQILEVLEFENNYLSKEWIYGKEPKYKEVNKKKFDFGEVIINYESNKGKLTKIQILGDFFTRKNIKELEEKLVGLDINNLKLDFNIENYIYGMKNKDFESLLRGD